MQRTISLAICFGLALIITNCTTAQEIIAHRGASFDAPENTMSAFRLAWEQGADAIEGDFHLTSDQQIVCIHDKDTERVCPANPVLTVAETDLDTLRKLDVGTWKDEKFAGETMPTLAEVLAVVPPGKKIFVELKTGPEILPVLKKQLAQSTLKPEQIVLICFKSAVIKQARLTMPEYQANWLVDYKMHEDGDQEVWTPSLKSVLKTLADTGATGLGSHGQMSVIDQAFVTAVADAGVGFHAWTIDEPEVAQTLKSYGTLSLTTNRPGFLRSSLAENSEESKSPASKSAGK